MNQSPEPPRSAEEFALALRKAISERGLSLDRLRHHLSDHGHELSIATLSYWQSGRSRPERASSLVALNALESILGLPAAYLADRLPPRGTSASVSRQGGPPERTATDFNSDGEVIDAMVKQLGLKWEHGLRSISLHDRIDIRSDRIYSRHLVRQVLQAQEDGVDRMVVWMQHGDPGSYPYFLPSTNCRLGMVLENQDRMIVVAELVLDRPLNKGEFMMVEYYRAAAGQQESFEYWHRAIMGHVRELHMEVKFHPDAIPVSAERVVVVDGVERVEPLLITSDSIQSLTLDFGPGSYGLRWAW